MTRSAELLRERRLAHVGPVPKPRRALRGDQSRLRHARLWRTVLRIKKRLKGSE